MFDATILKFNEQGEKTGWTYIEIPNEVVQQLKPNQKKSFRVTGKIDTFSIEKIALLPMGDGHFIMAINATMRKGIGKQKGAMVKVNLDVDDVPVAIVSDLVTCLKDEPLALKYFETLPKGHQNYFSNWIKSAKTTATKDKRIVMAVNALHNKMDFGFMIRQQKENRNQLLE
jgi:uncharacterized protein YdeI (YjbR/CyaY-like superfamily)